MTKTTERTTSAGPKTAPTMGPAIHFLSAPLLADPGAVVEEVGLGSGPGAAVTVAAGPACEDAAVKSCVKTMSVVTTGGATELVAAPPSVVEAELAVTVYTTWTSLTLQ